MLKMALQRGVKDPGHENLQTTQIYTHVSQDRLANVVEKAHPNSKTNHK